MSTPKKLCIKCISSHYNGFLNGRWKCSRKTLLSHGDLIDGLPLYETNNKSCLGERYDAREYCGPHGIYYKYWKYWWLKVPLLDLLKIIYLKYFVKDLDVF